MTGSNSLQDKVFLNGAYLPLSEAKISVLDRGFLFADGVYEVMPAYAGKFFRIDDHCERLQASLDDIKLGLHYTVTQWLNILEPLLDKGKDQYIYLQVTRGVAAKRDHAFPQHIEPTIFAMCSDIKPFSALKAGAKAITMDDNRWKLCNIKSTALLGNVLLRQEAVERDCAEAILYKNDIVTEGAASNLFAVIDDVLVTPRSTDDILLGITRKVILELAEQHDIHYMQRDISVTELKIASEIWVTSSTREIVPIIELDEQTVGNGKQGKIWCKMDSLFQDYKRR